MEFFEKAYGTHYWSSNALHGWDEPPRNHQLASDSSELGVVWVQYNQCILCPQLTWGDYVWQLFELDRWCCYEFCFMFRGPLLHMVHLRYSPCEGTKLSHCAGLSWLQAKIQWEPASPTLVEKLACNSESIIILISLVLFYTAFLWLIRRACSITNEAKYLMSFFLARIIIMLSTHCATFWCKMKTSVVVIIVEWLYITWDIEKRKQTRKIDHEGQMLKQPAMRCGEMQGCLCVCHYSPDDFGLRKC